jgi:hypothetical protein
MRENARNWRIEDLQTLANHYGVAYRQNGASHVFLTFDPGVSPLPAPAEVRLAAYRPVKALADAAGK